MPLRVVGAGLGRTGTGSLKLALEGLLGAPCYHMFELIQRPQDQASWESAVAGGTVDWEHLFAEYRATVDWPAAAFWREILAANPDAVVLLSTRETPEVWWASFEQTILRSLSGEVPADRPDWQRRRAMNLEMMRTRFTPKWQEREAAIAAYERHNEEVRRLVGAARLIDWRPGDGWEPICAGLGVAAPTQPFPHENTTADFQARADVSQPK